MHSLRMQIQASPNHQQSLCMSFIPPNNDSTSWREGRTTFVTLMGLLVCGISAANNCLSYKSRGEGSNLASADRTVLPADEPLLCVSPATASDDRGNITATAYSFPVLGYLLYFNIWDNHRRAEDNPVVVHIGFCILNLFCEIGHVIREAQEMLFVGSRAYLAGN